MFSLVCACSALCPSSQVFPSKRPPVRQPEKPQHSRNEQTTSKCGKLCLGWGGDKDPRGGGEENASKGSESCFLTPFAPLIPSSGFYIPGTLNVRVCVWEHLARHFHSFFLSVL